MATRCVMLVAALLICAACDDGGADAAGDVRVLIEPTPDAQPDPDPPDAAPNDAAALDALPADAEVDAGPWMPPPVVPVTEPTPIAGLDWLRGTVPRDADPLGPEFEDGDVHYPPRRTRDDGARWYDTVVEEDGTFSHWGITAGYAIGRVPVPPGQRLFATPDRVSALYTPGSVQPGDPYGSGRARVPLVVDPDDPVVAFAADPGRGAPKLQLFTTPDEVFFHFGDRTAPDLRAGEAAPLWLGVMVLNLRPESARTVTARVVESDQLEATATAYPALPGGAVSQLGFELRPKHPWPEEGAEVPIHLQLEARGLEHGYEAELVLTTRAAAGNYRQTFRTPIDGSVQYYGVNPPPQVEPGRQYALALSLHGAGVEAIGQSGSYAAKDWLYVIAPTNRRPFGFDWEEWGRFNALATLDDAMARFAIDPLRVYLTGHSMGGHGSWHVGVTTPDRFALVGPSAGWSSFYSYTGVPRPEGPVGRARAHSETMDYLENLAAHAVYVIHGDADNNVPVREGRDMFAAASEVTEARYHEQPGAGHWWSAGIGQGTDCVDWPPMFEWMAERSREPFRFDFHFRSPSPGYSPSFSFVRVEAAASPLADVFVDSVRDGDTVRLTTNNVRHLRLDATLLAAAGVTRVEVDGEAHRVVGEAIDIGRPAGKRAAAYGPFNQVFRRPFCFIAPDATHARLAAWFISFWAIIGNGHACALPAERAAEAQAAGYQLIRLGAAATGQAIDGIEWDDAQVRVGDRAFAGAAFMAVHPDGDALGAVMVAPPGKARLLLGLTPFSSRSGLPDYVVFDANGGRALGFFDADWHLDPAFGR
ncbi:MAG: prolyl oligopeptidase family serine peptidase [Myxococcales bacterium]|nr:prolyl oligopeptidase family serine peptidase [Myxococcales bacterium]